MNQNFCFVFHVLFLDLQSLLYFIKYTHPYMFWKISCIDIFISLALLLGTYLGIVNSRSFCTIPADQVSLIIFPCFHCTLWFLFFLNTSKFNSLCFSDLQMSSEELYSLLLSWVGYPKFIVLWRYSVIIVKLVVL